MLGAFAPVLSVRPLPTRRRVGRNDAEDISYNHRLAISRRRDVVSLTIFTGAMMLASMLVNMMMNVVLAIR